jgi:hypothetical protein
MTLAVLDGLKLLDVNDEDTVGEGNVKRCIRREMRWIQWQVEKAAER